VKICTDRDGGGEERKREKDDREIERNIYAIID
jgi:hypothetical protein